MVILSTKVVHVYILWFMCRIVGMYIYIHIIYIYIYYIHYFGMKWAMGLLSLVSHPHGAPAFLASCTAIMLSSDGGASSCKTVAPWCWWWRCMVHSQRDLPKCQFIRTKKINSSEPKSQFIRTKKNSGFNINSTILTTSLPSNSKEMLGCPMAFESISPTSKLIQKFAKKIN